MPSQSTSDRRKRSLSRGDEEGGDRRRRRGEKSFNRNFRDARDRISSKRPSDQDHGGSKFQRSNLGSSDRSRRVAEIDEDEEEKPTRASRFVGERKPEDYKRTGTASGGRDFGTDQFGRSRRSDLSPNRRDERFGRGGSDGNYRGGGGGAGYSRRGWSSGRWNSGRGGRGTRNRTVVYRPGEEEQKPTMNLFDPSQVPKGRSYFEHEDRLSETNRRFRGRGRGRFGSGRPAYWHSRSGDSAGQSGDVWQHDMFEDAEESNEASKSGETAMDEGK